MVEKKKFSKGKKAVAETKAKSPELMTDFDLSELVKAAKEVVPDVFIPEKGSLTEVSDWIAMPGPICEVLGDVPGLPCGHVVEILGPSDSGKTTLVTHAFIGAQSDDGLAVLADSEHKYDIDRAVAMGLDPKRLIIVPIETIEQAFDKFVAMMKVIRAKPEWSKRKIVFAWDSIGSTPCENELDEKTKDHAMLAAKALKAGLRKIRYFLRKTNASLLLINHVYEKQTKTPWEKKTRGYGGHAPEYFSTIRLECRAIGKITRKKKVDGKDVSVRLGIESEVECIKNHVAAPFRRVKIEIDRKGVVFGGRKAEL